MAKGKKMPSPNHDTRDQRWARWGRDNQLHNTVAKINQKVLPKFRHHRLQANMAGDKSIQALYGDVLMRIPDIAIKNAATQILTELLRKGGTSVLDWTDISIDYNTLAWDTATDILIGLL